MDPDNGSVPSSIRSSCSSGTSQQFCAHCKRSLQILSTDSGSGDGNLSFPCTNCRKAHYCSASHRKAHASKHEKMGCFPALVQSSPECGRYWIATRDIAMDEVILREKALIVAPNVPCISPLYPTCLGCNRGTNTRYRCSKCGWPMCSKKCEKMPNHSKNECKIFRKNGIESNCRPQYYFFIQFLRALLLKDQDPHGFAQLMELESHVQARSQVKEEVFMLKSFYKFLTEDCNLKYDYDLVNQVVGLNRVNCYSADGLIHGKKRFCTGVFPKLSFINHDCRPNTRTILHEEKTSDNGYALFMELVASVDIPEGEEISQQYISSTKGTLLRQETLMEDWFFHCRCQRCSDKTEYNTFFSAVKCTNCPDGYLLPLNPLDTGSLWKCGIIEEVASDPDMDDVNQTIPTYSMEKGCGYEKRGENVRCLVEELERQAKLNAYNIQKLQQLLSDISAYSLHPNHYLLINIKYGIVDDIVKKLNYPSRSCCIMNGAGFRANGNYAEYGGGDDGVTYEEIMKAVRYSKDILSVTRRICQGRSFCVGVILYFLGSCLMEMKIRKFPCKFTTEQVENVVREAYAILHVEADGTSYSEMARLLEDKSLAMNLETLSF